MNQHRSELRPLSEAELMQLTGDNDAKLNLKKVDKAQDSQPETTAEKNENKSFAEEAKKWMLHAEDLLLKETLSEIEQSALEEIMNKTRELRDAQPSYTETEITTDQGIYTIHEAISMMALKLNEEHIKSTNAKQIVDTVGTIEQIQVDPSGIPTAAEHAVSTAQGLAFIAKESGIANLEEASINEVPEKIVAQAQEMQYTDYKIFEGTREEHEARAKELWVMMKEAQTNIKSIKTSFFGPKPKFQGTLPGSFEDRSVAGLNLINADKIATWLYAKGRDTEADMVEAYSTAFVEYENSFNELIGVGNTGDSTRALDQAKSTLTSAVRNSGNTSFLK